MKYVFGIYACMQINFLIIWYEKTNKKRKKKCKYICNR